MAHGHKEAFPPQTHSLWEFGSATDVIPKIFWVGGFNLGSLIIQILISMNSFFFSLETFKAAFSYRISLLAERDAKNHLTHTYLNVFSLRNEVNSAKRVSVMHHTLAELP